MEDKEEEYEKQIQEDERKVGCAEDPGFKTFSCLTEHEI